MANRKVQRLLESAFQLMKEGKAQRHPSGSLWYDAECFLLEAWQLCPEDDHGQRATIATALGRLHHERNDKCADFTLRRVDACRWYGEALRSNRRARQALETKEGPGSLPSQLKEDTAVLYTMAGIAYSHLGHALLKQADGLVLENWLRDSALRRSLKERRATLAALLQL